MAAPTSRHANCIALNLFLYFLPLNLSLSSKGTTNHINRPKIIDIIIFIGNQSGGIHRSDKINSVSDGDFDIFY